MHYKITKVADKKTAMNELLIINPKQVVEMLLNLKVILVLIKQKKLKDSMPSHIGIFGLSQSKRIANKVVHEIHGFHSNQAS